jgi:hypothetical protein
MVGALKHIECMLGEDGVGWDTAWAAVELHGSPLVVDPRWVSRVSALGVDERSYLSATPEHSTIYATSLIDLDRRIVIDLFEGKSAAKLCRALRHWLKVVRGRGSGPDRVLSGRTAPASL